MKKARRTPPKIGSVVVVAWGDAPPEISVVHSIRDALGNERGSFSPRCGYEGLFPFREKRHRSIESFEGDQIIDVKGDLVDLLKDAGLFGSAEIHKDYRMK